MKHLLDIVKSNTQQQIKRPYPNRSFYSHRSKFILYKINGYWFRLNIKMWSMHLQIPEPTIIDRLRRNKSISKALEITDE